MIVEVDNLKKRYKKEWVLNGVDIQIDSPQIIALVGPNGSGKTTLLNAMTNLISINSGTVKLLDKKNTDPSIFKDVSFLQDNRILYGNLTAYDHLKFICDMQKIPRTRIKEVTEWVGMDSYVKKRVDKFSLGMKQHLLLAMVIINRPRLLLMDEPLNGLDPTSAINMRHILLDLHKAGTTLIVSSHNLDEIDRLTNSIFFMKDGLILKESLEDFAHKQYFLTVDNVAKAEEALAARGIPYSTNQQEQLILDEMNTQLETVIEELGAHHVKITDVENERIGAERRYRELFEKEASS